MLTRLSAEVAATDDFPFVLLQDRVIYQATGENDTLTYFYLSMDSGLISVARPLTTSSKTEFRVGVGRSGKVEYSAELRKHAC